nr:ORF6N domain-containing protein [uncultured Mucilaginibacter sp.]
MNNETGIISDETIADKIYHIRNKKVMLDKDLAALYDVPTGQLNRAVSRNLSRFPPDFMFQLTREELNNLMYQNGTSSWGGTRKLPNVFTEQGVAMLSGVLTSERAVSVNIQIMRIFTRVREIVVDNTELRLEIEKIKARLNTQDKNIDLVFQYLDEFVVSKATSQPRKRIGYKSDEL